MQMGPQKPSILNICKTLYVYRYVQMCTDVYRYFRILNIKVVVFKIAIQDRPINDMLY